MEHFKILFMFVSISCSSSDKCDFNKQCQCSLIAGSLFIRADCSNLRMRDLPRIPNYVWIVTFNNNKIRLVPDYTFENNSKLLELSIAHNKLQVLNTNSFYGLDNLINLRLNDNNIHLIENNTFTFLYILKYLNLKNNNFGGKYMDFKIPSSIRTLMIDFVSKKNRSFSDENLPLDNLDISGLSGHCEMKTLTPIIFISVPELEDLNISGCKINFIYKGSFRMLRRLKNLDISFNPCLKFSGLENVVFDLPYTSISVLKANRIHSLFELNTEIRISHIKPLRHTNLTELQLDSNRLQVVQKGALGMLPHTIRRLFISDNMFSFGDYLFDLVLLPIEFANLSFSFSSHVPSQSYSEEKCNAKVSKLRFQQEDVFSIKMYGTDLFLLPYHLKTLIYRQCLLHFPIPDLDLSENSVEYIDASYNLFYSWIGPVRFFNKTTYIDLSNNYCSYVSTEFFKSVPNIETLNLMNNLLGFVLPSDTDGLIFRHNPFLSNINLALNRIPDLPFKFFQRQLKIRTLTMRGNMLETINFQISQMKLLEFLDLSDNRISHLTQTTRDQLNVIIKVNSKFKIDLSDNPLRCTCETIDFVKWFSSNKARFDNHSSYLCRLSDGKREHLKFPEMLYDKLNKHCSSYTSLIIGVVAILVLFLLVLAWGLIYRHRWRLRYMYYMVKNKYQYKRHDSVNDETIYSFDAFISYENENRSFVHDVLRLKLEEEGGMKLCLHKRDFLPGNDIAANITSAIHRSRKVVVIMSRAFLDSYWCMFEYNMARVESIYSRNKENILFLVFYEPIPPKDLPLMVLELVQSQSYIEFPHDEYGDIVFWNKLKEALM